MKKLFLSLAIVFCASLITSVSAQEPKRGGKRNFPMEKELNLNSEQQEKIKKERADFKVKVEELQKQSGLNKEDKQAKMKELRNQHQIAVTSILTPEQQAKMKEVNEKRGDRKINKEGKDGLRSKARDMRNKKDDRRMAIRGSKEHRANRMKELNLTDEQKQKIKAENEGFRSKSKELFNEHQTALNNIYTPEQQAKLKEMRKDFAKDGRFAFHRKTKGLNNLDEASKSKLKELTENFTKEKKAVELSRIAPEAQKQKIADLRNNYRKEKRQIITEAKKSKENKPV